MIKFKVHLQESLPISGGFQLKVSGFWWQVLTFLVKYGIKF